MLYNIKVYTRAINVILYIYTSNTIKYIYVNQYKYIYTHAI